MTTAETCNAETLKGSPGVAKPSSSNKSKEARQG